MFKSNGGQVPKETVSEPCRHGTDGEGYGGIPFLPVQEKGVFYSLEFLKSLREALQSMGWWQFLLFEVFTMIKNASIIH